MLIEPYVSVYVYCKNFELDTTRSGWFLQKVNSFIRDKGDVVAHCGIACDLITAGNIY